MNIMKKGLALSLASVIALSPAISMAEDMLVVPISAPIVISEVEEVKMGDYMEFSGKITEVLVDGENTSLILVNDNKDSFNVLKVYLGDSILLSDKTMDLISKDLLEKDAEVSVFYHKHTPMNLSLPPILTPDVIVLRETEEPTSVIVDKFDSELLNEKGDLYLLVSEETNIVDSEGNKMTKADLANRDLLVFYSIVLESYPAQTSPEKIMVLPIREELEEPIEVKELVVNQELLFVNDKGITMIPLRFVAEELGYEVKWNNESRSVEISRGAQWSLITIGQDNYNFAKMRIELGTPPIIVNDKTYVPVSFAEQVLIGEVEVMENGAIKIVQ